MQLPALDSHPDAQTVAISGRNRDNAQKMADAWNIPQVYTDYREMIENAGLDAIVISTPNDSHYPITMKTLEQGIHVICDKPIALTYAQAQEMAALADEASSTIYLQFHANRGYLKELIEDSYIGRPYHLNLRYYSIYARDGSYMCRFDKAIAGSGIIGDLGSHFLYLAEWLYGKIKAITHRLSYIVEREPTDSNGSLYEVADDSCMLTVEFANGAMRMIHYTALAYEDTPFEQTSFMCLMIHSTAAPIGTRFSKSKAHVWARE